MSTRIVKFMKNNTIAMIALFIALGGTASAATLAANSVGNKQLKKNAVTTTKIKNKAVTGAKLAAGTVTGDKLAAGAVTGDKIAAGAVTGDKIAAGAVTGDKIAAGAVTGDKVNVSTLGKVPSAANADTLGGVSKSVWGTAVMYNGTLFVPRTSPGTTYQEAGPGNIGLEVTANTVGSQYFQQRLDLPQGATLTKVTMYYQNVVAGGSGTLWFSMLTLPTAGTTLTSAVSGSAIGASSVSMTPNVVIDNSTNAYILYWGPGALTNIFIGAKVEYTLPGATAGPVVRTAPQHAIDNGPTSEQ
jgi:hypothetical protein